MPRKTAQSVRKCLSGTVILAFASSVLGCGADASTEPPPSNGSTAQIEVRYASDISPVVDDAVKAAAARWSQALSKDLGDFQLKSAAGECFVGEPQLNETHRNLLLFVTELQIDGRSGELAYTDVCRLSSLDTLPIVAHIRIDRADLDSMVVRGVLQGVVMHEMAHALGFNPKTYMPKDLAGGGTSDPTFHGASAIGEFMKHGAWYTGTPVPLETAAGIGPREPHWRFTVFGDELMVGAVARGFKSPLSSITLGYFNDVGYTVDYSAADPYEVVPLFGGTHVLPTASLRDDLHQRMQPTFVTPLSISR
jgi:hypothetical protein